MDHTTIQLSTYPLLWVRYDISSIHKADIDIVHISAHHLKQRICPQRRGREYHIWLICPMISIIDVMELSSGISLFANLGFISPI